jgi:hypothetical protein
MVVIILVNESTELAAVFWLVPLLPSWLLPFVPQHEIELPSLRVAQVALLPVTTLAASLIPDTYTAAAAPVSA